MNRDTMGQSLTLTLFGESHGPAVGCVVQGLAPGLEIDLDFMARQLQRRKGAAPLSTGRREADAPKILSGAYRGRTTGTALCLLIPNQDTHSKDYGSLWDTPRPGHGDYTGRVKYQSYNDPRGGGHFSGRLTAPIVAAGSILLKLLEGKGVRVGTRLKQVGTVQDPTAFALGQAPCESQLTALSARAFPTLSPQAGEAMEAEILRARQAGDSVGGILETAVTGLPPGLGEPFFASVESQLAALLFSIPGVKGLEFGSGFRLAAMQGSQANDPFRMEAGKVVTATNHNGGVNGGITNGMPLLFSTAVKPTPSIYQPQATVDLAARENATLQIQGRHDPCIAHRAAAVQDSLAALCLGDLLNQALGLAWQQGAGWPKEAPWNTD